MTASASLSLMVLCLLPLLHPLSSAPSQKPRPHSPTPPPHPPKTRTPTPTPSHTTTPTPTPHVPSFHDLYKYPRHSFHPVHWIPHPSPHPTPTPTPIDPNPKLCNKAISGCRNDTDVLYCQKLQGCDHSKEGVKLSSEACKAAEKACADVFVFCLEEHGPPGCTPNGYVRPKHPFPVPVPTPSLLLPPPSPSPSPSPPPADVEEQTECEKAIKKCQGSSSFISCVADEGCFNFKNPSPACDSAALRCHNELVQCVKFLGIDCDV
jgi:hypothetical protein